MAHASERDWYFLIRARDLGSRGIADGLDLSDTEPFDVAIDLKLTRKQTNEVKELFVDKNHYHWTFVLPFKKSGVYPPRNGCQTDHVQLLRNDHGSCHHS